MTAKEFLSLTLEERTILRIRECLENSWTEGQKVEHVTFLIELYDTYKEE